MINLTDQMEITNLQVTVARLEHILEACECECITEQADVVRGEIARAKAAIEMTMNKNSYDEGSGTYASYLFKDGNK